MGLRLTFEVDGLTVIDRAFNRLTERISDYRKDIWPAVRDEFIKAEQDQFESGGTKGASGPWPDLSPAYEEWRAKHYTPFPFPLLRTLRLKKSLTQKGDTDFIYDAEPQELTLGSRVPYGHYHMKAYKKRPARPPISLSEVQKKAMMKAVQKELVKYVRAQGFTVEGVSDVA